MKFTKKNLFAIGAAVMMTASLATIASAATPDFTATPIDGDAASFEVVDVDVSTLDFSQMLEGAPIAASTDSESAPCTLASPTLKVGVASVVGVEVMDVDLDELDLSQALPGEPVVFNVDTPCTLDGGTESAVEVIDVDLDTMDFSQMLEGTPSADGQK